MLNTLFKFPIIMVDGEHEEKKAKIMDDAEMDIIEGTAECPFTDFLGLSDAWYPDEESFKQALENKKFNACRVHFSQCGSYTVPWTRAKFKKELQSFIDNYEKNNPREKESFMIPIEIIDKKPKEE